MPSTHTSLHLHIVFSTKDRVVSIKAEWRQRLHSYLGGALNSLSVVPLSVGGVADHVHLLVGIKPIHALSDVMRDVKKASSMWVHDEIGHRQFAWQEGYGAFSVSHSNLEQVLEYVEHQEAHHASRSFQDEYRELLQRHGIAFDEKYLW